MNDRGVEMSDRHLTVVAPVFNEAGGIEHFVRAVLQVLDTLPYRSALILVDDGSSDGTAEILDRLQAGTPERVTVVHLSRNFGHQAALTAGMDYADADAVICMDADMQHPPKLIPQLVERWQQGFDIVQTVRQQGENVGWLKRVTAAAFYRLINYLSATRIEPNGADFRLLSRRVVTVFQHDLRERDRFIRGLVSWVGFKYTTLEFDAAKRFAGDSKYSFAAMLRLARVGLISFSKMPLKVASLLGLVVSALSGVYALYAVGAFLFFRTAVLPGWASTVLVGLFLGGCQLLFLGLIGEYIATIFDEIKGRPLYVVSDVRNAVSSRDPGTPRPQET